MQIPWTWHLVLSQAWLPAKEHTHGSAHADPIPGFSACISTFGTIAITIPGDAKYVAHQHRNVSLEPARLTSSCPDSPFSVCLETWTLASGPCIPAGRPALPPSHTGSQASLFRCQGALGISCLEICSLGLSLLEKRTVHLILTIKMLV